ncbi:sigma factor [Metasolibacillus meyeri]|uniref:Sigma factor n=1 Tax=Metasolibacillus meyeri TaxID=1071052 RepID=A0AAW9NPV2_9BACL|nr:sigma factor [Metasolibacillus meyeri]MEC1179582.1 sigma factor [Metasolibacillus meyeri]
MYRLEDVMNQYTDLLFRIAYYYTKDVQTSEDIVQEIFIKYYYSYNHQEHEALKALLAKMTANKCKDHLKSWAYRKLILYKKLPIFKVG